MGEEINKNTDEKLMKLYKKASETTSELFKNSKILELSDIIFSSETSTKLFFFIYKYCRKNPTKLSFNIMQLKSMLTISESQIYTLLREYKYFHLIIRRKEIMTKKIKYHINIKRIAAWDDLAVSYYEKEIKPPLLGKKNEQSI